MNRQRALLGLTFDDRPIWEPRDAGSSLTFAAAGGGKTTCRALPLIMSILADSQTALFINDVKSGEIAAQIAPLCEKYGRKFGMVDEFGERPELGRYRISLNPFGDLTGMLRNGVSDLPFHIENLSHALIEEPKDDAKNFYWREEPRASFIELAIDILLDHNARLAFPGGVYALLADPQSWVSALEIEAEEGEEYLKARARQVLEMREKNPEHYSQHLGSALSHLKIFARGPLKEAGRDPTLTHKQLIEEGRVVCFVNAARHTDRLGTFYASHFLSLLNAKLAGAKGRMELVLDEFCNAPMRDAVRRVTIQRAYGVRSHFLAQSRQDAVLRYGERETAILEENCTTKQYLKFSNFEEAERVSRAMGDGTSISSSISVDSVRENVGGSFSSGKERHFTADELMRLPPDEQILHVAGVGFIHCRKIRQNQIGPYCYDLGNNPLEGARMTPDPKVDLFAGGRGAP